MKKITLLIGLMLALVLCITPVAAVSATPVATVSNDDFYFYTHTWDDGTYKWYIYARSDSSAEMNYFPVFLHGSRNSLVTFKPAHIPDAPTMVVKGGENAWARLPKCVDYWEIKYYSGFNSTVKQDDDYLQNAGVVNLYELFKKYNSYDFYLELIDGKYIMSPATSKPALIYTIPDAPAPEAKVTGDGFKIISSEENGWHQHKYCNLNNPNEKYIVIHTEGTKGKISQVTFKPANIEGAPVMVAKTTQRNVRFYLPQSVDEWEIKYYSGFNSFDQQDVKYLKNAGVVNLKEYFEECILDELWLELSLGQYIAYSHNVITGTRYSIPDV